MPDPKPGTATATSAPVPALRTDGPCLRGTLATLGRGPKAMSPNALAKVKEDALDLLGRVAARYAADVAPGEVGADGTGVAASGTGSTCTGLLYGRIQSGKTVAMISLVAAALDNGFRVIVVLTSDNVTLVSQTSDRFAALDGPLVLDALNPASWKDDASHIAKKLPQNGLVCVCSKNKGRLGELIKFLATVGAPNFPALILDDEADQATLDTNTARRSRSKKKGGADIDPTAIHDRVVNELCASLRHNVFLQVTATPYALLLQSVGTALRPSFTRLLEPGEGYTGGEAFFEAAQVEDGEPPLVFVDADESADLTSKSADCPDGLRNAIGFFVVAACAQTLLDDGAPARQNFLCHTSQLRTEHNNLRTIILDYVNKIDDALVAGKGEGFNRISTAYLELQRTCPEAPELDAIIDQAKRALVKRRVVVVNAEADGVMGPGMNFIVGGNILGRGVTIENLLVTYYLREPKMGQMDTMLQHARMYGYRQSIMRFTRVFLPVQLAMRFHEIHRMEQRLRKQLTVANLAEPIAIERTSTLQPTRRTVLDPDYIDAFSAGDQIYPVYPDLRMDAAACAKINARIAGLVGGLTADTQLVAIDFDTLVQLVEEVPFDLSLGSSSWLPQVLVRVLEQQRERCGGKAWLLTRRMKRRSSAFATGALSGDELEAARSRNAPTFCAFRDDGSQVLCKPPASPYWYPTLVFDKGMPDVIVNVSADEA